MCLTQSYEEDFDEDEDSTDSSGGGAIISDAPRAQKGSNEVKDKAELLELMLAMKAENQMVKEISDEKARL